MSEHNIHPIFDRLVSRDEQQRLLNQKSKVFWFTGLSGSGKSTIAEAFERALYNQGYFVKVLDGDNIRSGLNNNLGFSIEDRTENIRRIAEVAKLFLDSGVIVLCSFVSPTQQIRELAQSIIGEKDFIEVFVDTPLEVCEKRDVKGLYKKARAGQIKGFTGIDSPFEAPIYPTLTLSTIELSPLDCVNKLLELI
ncbi:MAG: adenylyl-sulfate kinase [Saprospiraceae bacterium]|nr:adenylyl-sulfate kinase [Saprospiraceae bacterium]